MGRMPIDGKASARMSFPVHSITTYGAKPPIKTCHTNQPAQPHRILRARLLKFWDFQASQMQGAKQSNNNGQPIQSTKVITQSVCGSSRALAMAARISEWLMTGRCEAREPTMQSRPGASLTFYRIKPRAMMASTGLKSSVKTWPSVGRYCVGTWVRRMRACQVLSGKCWSRISLERS